MRDCNLNAPATDDEARRSRRLVIVAFCVIWAAAIAPGILATRGLQWPTDQDNFRDIAAAQSLLDRHAIVDPFYAHEAAWYSPLVPALVALTASISHAPVPRAFVTLGPWLNALVPLVLFLAASALVGESSALLAVTLFLFAQAAPPPWASSSYSPWLFPSVTAQALGFAAIATCLGNLKRPTVFRALTLGILLGVTFLAHPAPAVVGATVVTLTALATGLERRAALSGPPSVAGLKAPRYDRTASRAIAFVVTVASAALVVAPLLVPMAARYGFRVLNDEPARWLYGVAEPAAIAAACRDHAGLTVLLAVLVSAGAYRVWSLRDRSARHVLVAWGIAAACLFAYALIAERDLRLPALVPVFHFYFALQVWLAILCGAGLATLIAFGSRALPWRRSGLAGTLGCVIAALAIAALRYPDYLRRPAFTTAAEGPRGEGAQRKEDRAYAWLRRYTGESDVFLASDRDALTVVGPAGRHVVCVGPSYASPYVDAARRASARDRMFDALAAADRAAFSVLAREFEVTYIVTRASDEPALEHALRDDAWLQPAFETGDTKIFRVVLNHDSR